MELSTKEYLDSVINPNTRKSYQIEIEKFSELLGKSPRRILEARNNLPQRTGKNLIEYCNRTAVFEREIEKFHGYPMKQIEFSFVIPACNEEESIETSLFTLDGLVKKDWQPYEIIVVNDGSKDGTLPQVVKYAYRNGHVKVVSYALNEGKGYAIKRGFMRTKGDIVILADGDMEIDFNQISSYIQALKRADIVIASKWHPQSTVKMPFLRKIFSRSFNVLVRLLTGVTLRDTQTGLKVIRRSVFADVFRRLAVKRYAFDVELLAVANLYGLRVVEMPVHLKMNGRFKMKDMWKMFIDLLGIAYRLRVRRFYQKSQSVGQSKKSYLLNRELP